MNDKEYNRYIIRKPLFPYDILFDGIETKNLDKVINNILQNDEFIASIYWSSPDVYDSIIEYKKGSLPEDKKNKLLQTLKKYAIRMSTRSTPYGTMAGVAMAYKENGGNKLGRFRKARIDMELLSELKKHIENNEAIKRHLKYKVNNTVSLISTQYRYQEIIAEDSNKCQFSSIESNLAIDKIASLSHFAHYQQISNLFADDFIQEEIADFIDELIDMQFLVSELQLSLTSDNVLNVEKTLERLVIEGISDAEIYLKILKKIDGCVAILERESIGYLPVVEIDEIKTLIHSLGIKKKHFFHIDLNQESQNQIKIKDRIFQNIFKAISLCNRLKSQKPVSRDLETFKDVFRVRYEHQEVPLTKLLDPEFGIGFPTTTEIGNIGINKITEGVTLNRTNGLSSSESKNFILDIIENNKEKIIDLDKCELPPSEELTKMDDFFVVGSFVKDYFFLQNISMSSVNSILGRFALFNTEVEELCQEIATRQSVKNFDIIYAEIISIPSKRIANIARRPQFSEYEIPIVGRIGNGAKAILVSDIMVSVQNDEIILRSKSLNKRIIPRLSNAHNFITDENSFYKFLCEVALQNQKKIGLQLEYASLKKRYFPRIIYKNIILSRARWIMYEEEIKAIKNSSNPRSKLKEFFKKWDVEKYVVLIHGDNELFLDLSNESYLSLLLDELRNTKIVHLAEWLFPANGYIYEQIIIPLKTKEIRKLNSPIEQKENLRQRQFTPGSEWLYFKLYCSTHISDELMQSVISPFLEEGLNNKLFESAFFIHYIDPNYHIRLRIHLNDGNQFINIVQKMNSLLHNYLDDQRVWKIQLDTYVREIERYGPDFIEDTERAFFYDSLLVLKLLHKSPVEDDTRLFLAIKNIDYWLTFFDLPTIEKLAFCKNMENAFLSEFSREFKEHIKLQYRLFKEELYLFMKSDRSNKDFDTRQQQLQNLKLDRNRLSSYIHMSLNRWFPSEQRALEFMAYSFSTKYYSKLIHSEENEHKK